MEYINIVPEQQIKGSKGDGRQSHQRVEFLNLEVNSYSLKLGGRGGRGKCNLNCNDNPRKTTTQKHFFMFIPGERIGDTVRKEV